MFCFKGTVSQDFLLQVLFIFPQASENPQICGLKKFVTFADFDLQTQYFCDLRFADQICCGL
jgi:hypothetical protein